jgi:dimeric dUTPase (all-alpha-NTP-PPase superfamily)
MKLIPGGIYMNKLTLMVEMLNLQHDLNTGTCGDTWQAGYTRVGRSINWLRYLRVEMVELITSSDKFKHWKNLNGDVDYDNIMMEVVDGWHFLMSESLLHLDISTIVEMADKKVYTNAVPKDELDYFEIIDVADEMIDSTYNHDVKGIDEMFTKFFKLVATVGMSFEDLYKQYVVKNILNRFRQDNGYKEGTYIKIINGEEDNVHMMNIATTHPHYTPKELYDEYDFFYATNTKK